MIQLKKYLRKNMILHYLIIAGAVVLLNSPVSSILSSIFNFGEVWVNFASILIIIIFADILSEKLLKIK